jgi:MarR family transcriptional regulator for hemolysin
VLEHDFQSSIGYWVHMAGHRFECAMNSELAEHGITYRQCQVLAWLALRGDLSQVDLARYARVEPPTMVRVLDCMERDGLIRRSGDPRDRRRKIIRPTRRALPVWNKIVACAARVRARAVQGLSPVQVDRLRSLLEVVHDNLNDGDEPPATQTGKQRARRKSSRSRGAT